jgi:hypothetical protein
MTTVATKQQQPIRSSIPVLAVVILGPAGTRHDAA